MFREFIDFFRASHEKKALGSISWHSQGHFPKWGIWHLSWPFLLVNIEFFQEKKHWNYAKFISVLHQRQVCATGIAPFGVIPVELIRYFQVSSLSSVFKAFCGVKWSKVEAFFDVSKLIQSKKTVLSRKGIFSRFIFSHKYSDIIHNQQL